MKNEIDEYANGLNKAVENIIYFCKSEIQKIKDAECEPNTHRQITNGGKLLAYNKVLQRLYAKKRVIEANKRV